MGKPHGSRSPNHPATAYEPTPLDTTPPPRLPQLSLPVQHVPQERYRSTTPPLFLGNPFSCNHASCKNHRGADNLSCMQSCNLQKTTEALTVLREMYMYDMHVRCSHASLSAIDSVSALFSSPSPSSASKQRARQLGQLAFTVNQLSKHWGSRGREGLEGESRSGG